MKTVTEFFGPQLIIGIKKVEEITAAGKSPEETQQAVGEAFKLEGDKLKHFLNAIESVKGRLEGLKRVVVLTFGEKDKVPSGAHKKDEHFYLAEFYPSLNPPKTGRFFEDRGGRGGRGGKKGGKARGRRGERGRHGPPRDLKAQEQGVGPAPVGVGGSAPAEGGAPGEQKRPRRRWRPRGPKKMGEGMQAGAEGQPAKRPVITPNPVKPSEKSDEAPKS